MMRAVPARWFEVLCARQDVSLLLDALGRSGVVQLEAPTAVAMPAEWQALGPGLSEFEVLRQRNGRWWPRERIAYAPCPGHPAEILQRALEAVRRWDQSCSPAVAELEALQQERAQLDSWEQALSLWQAQAAEPLPLPDRHSRMRLVLICGGLQAPAPEPALRRELYQDDEVWGSLLLLPLEQAVALTGSRTPGAPACLIAPAALADWPHAGAAGWQQQRERLLAREAELHAQCRDTAQQLGLAAAVVELERLAWIARSVHALATTELLAFVTGWSADRSGLRLQQAVAGSGARALLHYPPAPEGLRAPRLLENPRWARAFELYARAFGVPGEAEADPTPIVAFVVPLMFGYMFGDVGQGAVILLLGLWLSGRQPLARMLVPAGLSSMLFGFLYGSVFCLEHLIPPLWLHPLAHPVEILSVPLLFGAALLLLGLGLSALAAHWQGRAAAWLAHHGGSLWIYLAVLSSFIDLRLGQGLAVLGLLNTVLGARSEGGRWSAVPAALGELLESSFQLLVNTLSFARVGAFALAHAGLASAVLALAEAAGHPLAMVLVLILGNLLILSIEAMVVSIQATRLVLFEFFARFLTGSGRVFVPLPPPPPIPVLTEPAA